MFSTAVDYSPVEVRPVEPCRICKSVLTRRKADGSTVCGRCGVTIRRGMEIVTDDDTDE